MLSEPDTLSAGPPGPRKLEIRFGMSPPGNWNDNPRVVAPVPVEPWIVFRFDCERWVQSRSKLRRVSSGPNWRSESRDGSTIATCPNSTALVTVPESGSKPTRSWRGSEVSRSRANAVLPSGRVPTTNEFSSASMDGVFHAGGSVSWTAGGLRRNALNPGSPKPGKASNRLTSGAIRVGNIQDSRGTPPTEEGAWHATVTAQ